MDWNNVLSNVIVNYAKESQSNTAFLDLSMKVKAGGELQSLGSIIILKDKVKLHWGDENEEKDGEDDDDADNEDKNEMPKEFKKLISKEKGTKVGCATPKEIKLLHENDDENARVLVSEVNSSEWWTMVSSLFY